MFAILICRVYRTTSSDSSLILAVLEQVDLVIARETAFDNVISLGVSIHCFVRYSNPLCEAPSRSFLHPAHESPLHFFSTLRGFCITVNLIWSFPSQWINNNISHF
ncbi:hypothetical protein AVEN_167448-1 [Araneus ventricosus]|uniref:Uncharacterized protein n=1 Tax=Araneus ventricosus TaxID=182803 RepID=A0A4Y2EQ37_ARAVE|nr:hypothetical protein AVEN_167448-1 [Araneus ventricosus]